MAGDVVEIFLKAKEEVWIDDEDEVLELICLPGLSEGELQAVESWIQGFLPKDLRRLAACCEGMWVTYEINFAGRGFWFGGMPELFPAALPIMMDGFGNFWVVDCLTHAEESARVFFVCHDPPIILFQSASMAEFLSDLVGLHRPGGKSTIEDVNEDMLFHVWDTNPDALPWDEALRSGDPILREFARELEDGFFIVDLRFALPGQGFSWGRFGPKTRLRRFGEERVFAYGPPEKHASFLSNLLNRN